MHVLNSFTTFHIRISIRHYYTLSLLLLSGWQIITYYFRMHIAYAYRLSSVHLHPWKPNGFSVSYSSTSDACVRRYLEHIQFVCKISEFIVASHLHLNMRINFRYSHPNSWLSALDKMYSHLPHTLHRLNRQCEAFECNLVEENRRELVHYYCYLLIVPNRFTWNR